MKEIKEVFNHFDRPLDLIVETFELWFTLLIKNIPNIIVSIILFIIFMLTSRITVSFFSFLIPKKNLNQSLIDLMLSLAKILHFTIGAAIILTILGLDKAILSILAGLGVAGVAIGFAFKDFMANFVSGVSIVLNSPFKINDLIEISDMTGWVKSIRLRETVLRTFDGQVLHIPNKFFLENAFKNYTNAKKRRIDFSVGVSYSDDLEKAIAVISENLQKRSDIMDNPAPQVVLDEFGSSSMNIRVLYWIRLPEKDYLQLKSDGIIETKRVLEKNGFSIPFPIRTLMRETS